MSQYGDEEEAEPLQEGLAARTGVKTACASWGEAAHGP